MKFSYKILLCTIIIMAAAFGFSGFHFVNFVFETSLEREVEQAMDESSILQFAFETAALNIPSKYNILQDAAVSQIGAQLERGGRERPGHVWAQDTQSWAETLASTRIRKCAVSCQPWALV